MSTASTHEEVNRKMSIAHLKSRTLAIPTPKPLFQVVASRNPLPLLSKPPGLIMTHSLPAECFTSPMLFIKMEKNDYEADNVDIQFVTEYMFTHAIHKDKIYLKEYLKA